MNKTEQMALLRNYISTKHDKTCTKHEANIALFINTISLGAQPEVITTDLSK